VEGGYYLVDDHKFIGAAFPTERRPPGSKGHRRPTGPPPREADLIESQIAAAIQSRNVLFVIKEVPPSTVAIRTAPVIDGHRVIGATWTMIRLVDPLFLDRSLRGYRQAAGLALGGIVIALFLMTGLLRTIQRQSAERERLSAELRRKERLAALGKLLAGVAHEVRNPLAGIRSTAQLWQRGIGPDEESISNLVNEVDRLDRIVARLLQFSKADAQDMERGDLNGVVAEVARLSRASAEAQGVRVVLDLEANLPLVLMAPPAIVQVLRNLATNAVQAMPDGGFLRFSTRLQGTASIEVEVSDTGPGLPSSVREHLFEPFFTTKAEGTGLGLAIAREIALAHHGDLRAQNRDGEPGAVFILVLPTAKNAEAKGLGMNQSEHFDKIRNDDPPS
jgi:signal transduction histidine kinase